MPVAQAVDIEAIASAVRLFEDTTGLKIVALTFTSEQAAGVLANMKQRAYVIRDGQPDPTRDWPKDDSVLWVQYGPRRIRLDIIESP